MDSRRITGASGPTRPLIDDGTQVEELVDVVFGESLVLSVVLITKGGCDIVAQSSLDFRMENQTVDGSGQRSSNLFVTSNDHGQNVIDNFFKRQQISPYVIDLDWHGQDYETTNAIAWQHDCWSYREHRFTSHGKTIQARASWTLNKSIVARADIQQSNRYLLWNSHACLRRSSSQFRQGSMRCSRIVRATGLATSSNMDNCALDCGVQNERDVMKLSSHRIRQSHRHVHKTL